MNPVVQSLLFRIRQSEYCGCGFCVISNNRLNAMLRVIERIKQNEIKSRIT